MTELARIEDQIISTDDLIKSLQLGGRFNELLEELVRDKLVARAAARSGLTVADDEVQTRADHLRRIMGLHRAADMLDYLERMRDAFVAVRDGRARYALTDGHREYTFDGFSIITK